MDIVLIKSGDYVIQILLGKSNNKIQKLVEELNNNPLYSEPVTIHERYTDKSLQQLLNFLDINII